MRVATAAIVMQSFHAGHANGNLGEPFAPRPAESVCDEDAAFAANDATALGDGQFDDASVQAIAARPAPGSGGGFGRFQVHELTLRFGNDFMLNDEDIAFAQSLLLML